MGFYERRVLPRILNTACGTKTVEPLRRRVCEGLAGGVVEIGFGSGLNIPSTRQPSPGSPRSSPPTSAGSWRASA
jgi:hypothetical protein